MLWSLIVTTTGGCTLNYSLIVVRELAKQVTVELKHELRLISTTEAWILKKDGLKESF